MWHSSTFAIFFWQEANHRSHPCEKRGKYTKLWTLRGRDHPWGHLRFCLQHQQRKIHNQLICKCLKGSVHVWLHLTQNIFLSRMSERSTAQYTLLIWKWKPFSKICLLYLQHLNSVSIVIPCYSSETQSISILILPLNE